MYEPLYFIIFALGLVSGVFFTALGLVLTHRVKVGDLPSWNVYRIVLWDRGVMKLPPEVLSHLKVSSGDILTAQTNRAGILISATGEREKRP